MSPFNAYMTLLGLETLSLRMDRHVGNSRKIAEFLQNHEKVEWVSYAELEGHSHHMNCVKNIFQKDLEVCLLLV